MLRRPLVLIAAAAACAVAGALVYLAAMHVGPVESADRRVLEGFTGLRGGHRGSLAQLLATVFNPAPFATLAAAAVGVGLARRRPLSALCAGAAMLAANVTTQVLKPALATPRPPVPGAFVAAASWPSGHATASMSLALALVLVSAPRWRPVAGAVGGLLAVGVVYSILLLGWHYPSDVLGGFLVAGFWSCLLAAVALRRPAGARVRARSALAPPVLASGVLLGAVAVLTAARPEQVSAYASGHTTFAVGAAALAAAAVALAAAVSAVLSAQR